jgi:hypothetical protein
VSYEEEDTCGVVYLSTITIICNKYLPSNLGETIGSINCTSAAVLLFAATCRMVFMGKY